MPSHKRRLISLGIGAAVALGSSRTWAQARRKPLRMLLNTSYSGPQAWMLLARDNGHLAREGIEIDFTQGAGAYTAAPRMIDGDFDLAYGDVNSLIEEIARRPNAAPTGVFMLFNASPSAIAVRADGPIRRPKDLEGASITGHDTDVALRTFGAFCQHAGVDASRVKVNTSWSGMRGMLEDVIEAKAPLGAFGYMSTFTGAVATANPGLLERVRFLKYADHAPDLYGSVLMASRRLLHADPGRVAGVVRAFNRGLNDLLHDIDSGIAAVARQASGIDPTAEKRRLQTTFGLEMAHAEGRRLGIGDVDDARLTRAIALMASSAKLPRIPATREVFLRDHLPPLHERVTGLAKLSCLSNHMAGDTA